MTVTINQIAEFTGNILAEVGGNPDSIPETLRKRLGEYGFDPEGVEQMAQTILNLAIAQGDEPEPTILASFQIGVIIGAGLGEKP